MSSIIDDYENQTITITPSLSHNRYGEETFGAPVTLIPSRVQYQEAVENDSNSKSIRAFVYCDQDVNCPVKSKATIDGIEWKVNAVNRYVDLDGSFAYMRITVNRTYQNVN